MAKFISSDDFVRIIVTVLLYFRLKMVLRKDQLEAQLHVEKKEISDGKLKDDNPLDLSQSFMTLCEACRRGDLKVCQEAITEGANINARDRFDYTPLILVGTYQLFLIVHNQLISPALKVVSESFLIV